MANATTVDIDLSSFAIGDDMTGLTVNGATISNGEIRQNPANDPSIITYFGDAGPVRIDFTSTMVTSFSVNGSDFGADQDNYFLEAYGVGDVLLASDSIVGPEGSEDEFMMSVAANFIQYVVFYDTDPFQGAVYWSDMSYTTASPIPLPAGGLLLVGALGGLAIARRRKQA
ncbi:hypothetical protein A8B78_08785 [Jannaschia sp. EhC01]|nr:hypothetical protein A8B78_08785 [Jannaschia sp. EhC01]